MSNSINHNLSNHNLSPSDVGGPSYVDFPFPTLPRGPGSPGCSSLGKGHLLPEQHKTALESKYLRYLDFPFPTLPRGPGPPGCSSPGNTHQLPGHHKTAPNTYFPVSNLQFSSMFHRFSLNSKNPVSKQASHLPRTSQNSLRYLVPGLQYLIFIGFP